MIEKLAAIKERWEKVEQELASPDAMADMKRFAQLNRDYKDLRKIVEQYELYKNILSNIDTNKEILATEKDDEFREMAREELDQLIEDRRSEERRVGNGGVRQFRSERQP